VYVTYVQSVCNFRSVVFTCVRVLRKNWRSAVVNNAPKPFSREWNRKKRQKLRAVGKPIALFRRIAWVINYTSRNNLFGSCFVNRMKRSFDVITYRLEDERETSDLLYSTLSGSDRNETMKTTLLHVWWFS